MNVIVSFGYKMKSLFVSYFQDADGSVPFFWGADSQGCLVLSNDMEIVKRGCGKSFAPFPKGIACIIKFLIWHYYIWIICTTKIFTTILLTCIYQLDNQQGII